MSRAGAAVVVGLALSGLVVAGEVAPVPAEAPNAPRAVSVVGTDVVCPDLRQVDPVLRTRVSAGAVQGPSVQGPSVQEPTGAAAGTVQAQALSDVGPPVPLALTAPGQVVVGLAQELDGDALLVRATGALAPGLQVEQVTRGTSGTQRGLAALRCEAARTDAWWVGGATTVGDAAVLLLANPDDTPAVVDVEVLTASGRVDGRPGRGIAVGPRSRTAVPLDRLAPDREWLAVHVRTVRGRVAGGLRHVRSEGRSPRGVDWVPPAGEPAAQVVVPGLPAGPGRRIVVVANPGPDDTVAALTLATTDGLVSPPELQALDVPAGTTVAHDVSSLVAQTPAAVRVVSEAGPVLASALVVDAQHTAAARPVGRVRELAWTGPAEPLRGPALLTVPDPPTESTLLLSALDGDARVRVTPVPVTPVQATGRDDALPEGRTVDVSAGRTVPLALSTLPEGATGQIAVEVRPLPGSGPVHAARYLRERGEDGPLSTVLVLRSAAAQVLRPVAVPDLRAGTG